ncbi:chemotaxis protein [Salmonella enterica subsp. diarizonae]|nr:chemotaxis protein [Salmonella enterica]ECE0111563.1 chemotaxis protein [Salmonella enterica subsp. diarizonae]ECN6755153.1 chemotaxis protein [Salmonella enterica subsp. enterica serovar Newport]EAQ6117320.1 chemotaxis protein [Salmonella enterica]ECC6253418.1 chemotaxis protein [Salmonella enterica]
MYTLIARWIRHKWHRSSEKKTTDCSTPVNAGKNVPTDKQEKSYSELLCGCFLSGTGATAIIRDSLLLSSQRLMQELVTIDELNQKNELAREGMERLSELVELIGQNSAESSGHIDDLIAVLKGISDNIDGINKLSRQTNLLAINSAIEAAHVGGHGAGFSVIAKEIKQLSSEIQSQAGNITLQTQDISQHARNVGAGAGENSQLTHDIHIATEQARRILLQVIGLSSRMQKIIRFIATQQFLNTVKLDHVIWKANVYEMILHRDMDSVVNSHTECRLGKWYYGEAGRRFLHLNGFIQLEAPHAEVHRAGQEALEAFRESNDEIMKKNLVTMELASMQVIKCIDELLIQIEED